MNNQVNNATQPAKVINNNQTVLTTIKGNVGKTIKSEELEDGRTVVNFSVAQNFDDKDGKRVTKWFHVKAWEETALDLLDNIQSGDFLKILAVAKPNSWTKDGETFNETILTVKKWRFLSKKAQTA